jgi:prephenate dehydrogenase
VALIGLGLMGGSLGLACKQRQVAGSVSGYARREETRKRALELGAVDEVYDAPEAAVADADLVVFCTPILSIQKIAEQCAPNFRPGVVVTDVGSTKAQLTSGMSTLTPKFVGSHPIAGSHQTGLEKASGDLFEGRVVVITPMPDSNPESVSLVSGLWTRIGSRVVTMTPDRHDELVARTSHLPHLVAAMLVEHVATSDLDGSQDLCGSGFSDTTRIAEGSPDVWHDIVASNASCILSELDRFQKTIDSVRDMVKAGDYTNIRKFLEKSRIQRRTLLG